MSGLVTNTEEGAGGALVIPTLDPLGGAHNFSSIACHRAVSTSLLLAEDKLVVQLPAKTKPAKHRHDNGGVRIRRLARLWGKPHSGRGATEKWALNNRRNDDT